MTSRNTLFPSASYTVDDKSSNVSLFPSASSIHATDSVNRDKNASKDLEWLENKSFTSDTAKKLVEFQEELKVLQSGESSKTFDNDVKQEKPKVSRSYQSESKDYSSRVSDHQDEERRDKTRKKNKKHRHSRSTDSDSSDDDRHYKKKKSKHHKHRKSREKDQETDKPAKVTPEASKHIFKEDVGEGQFYRLDRKSDPNSWHYQSLYKQHVPGYKCYLGGQLGSHLRYLSVHDKSKKKRGFENRYFGKDNRGLLKRPAEENLGSELKNKRQVEGGSTAEGAEFLEITAKEEQQGVYSKDVRDTILDPATQRYVQGQGVADSVKPEEETPLDPHLVRVAEFNRQLRETPHNTQLWLDFVKFQDTLTEDSVVSVDSHPDTGSVKPQSRSAVEKKLSILDKALACNPGSLDLQLARLGVCRDVWEGRRVERELEQLLFVHPANPGLWSHYLTYSQTRLASFTVARVSKAYHRCFNKITAVLEGRFKTHTVPEHLDIDLTGLFLQYCYYLKQAGHQERSVATLQAAIEFNLFCPPPLESASVETKMAEFELYWESGAGQVGSEGSSRWRDWAASGKHRQEPPGAQDKEEQEGSLEDQEQAVLEGGPSQSQAWLTIEALRQHHHWLPLQQPPGNHGDTGGNTEDDCEDIERIILFDDVSPALINVPQQLHCDLVLAFLDLLGLKPQTSRFKTSLIIENYCDVFCDGERLKGCGKVCGRCSNVSNDVQNFAIYLLVQVKDQFKGRQKLKLTLALIEIQLRKFYHQASLSKTDKKAMRRIVKHVLKEEENRNNLFMWGAYIDLERVIGKPGEAETVAQTALAMYTGAAGMGSEGTREGIVQGAGAEEREGLVALCAQYCELLLGLRGRTIEEMWERRRPPEPAAVKKVIYVLHCLVEGKKFSVNDVEDIAKPAVLRDRVKYSRWTDSLISQLASDINKETERETAQETVGAQLLGVAWCQSLLVYCTQDLQAALQVCDRLLVSLTHGAGGDTATSTHGTGIPGDTGEALRACQLRLLLHHMSTASSSVSLLRSHLNAALAQTPTNPQFLSLFIDIERKSRISGRLNRYFDTGISGSSSPVVVAMAVQAQINLLQELAALQSSGDVGESGMSSSSLAHRCRVWLERSLSSGEDFQHCPLLWRLYLQLERSVGNARRVKGIFYRAIQQCPWVKSLYMEGVGSLGADSLQEIVDLMTEKELRVQLPVEELDILMAP